MTNFLRYPEFLSLTLLDRETKAKFTQDIETLIAERGVWDGFATLTFSEVDQLRRMLDYMNSSIDDDKLTLLRTDFKSFVDEYDRRRNTNFNQVFPELTNFYNLCNKT